MGWLIPKAPCYSDIFLSLIMKIGTAIKTVRIKFGISQEELSNLSGLSQTSISQIENGVKAPTQNSLKKISAALGTPEAVLYILAMDEADIPPNRKEAFEKLYPQIRELAIQILGNRNSKPLNEKK
jgi:XRE family transcriptional regulator, regulator of sulfur utilization